MSTTAKPWLAHYPPGVSADVAIDPQWTLVDILETAFKRYATRDAAACMGTRLKFADIDRLSLQLAAWLQSKGLAPGVATAKLSACVSSQLDAAVKAAGSLEANVEISVNVSASAAHA